MTENQLLRNVLLETVQGTEHSRRRPKHWTDCIAKWIGSTLNGSVTIAWNQAWRWFIFGSCDQWPWDKKRIDGVVPYLCHFCVIRGDISCLCCVDGCRYLSADIAVEWSPRSVDVQVSLCHVYILVQRMRRSWNLCSWTHNNSIIDEGFWLQVEHSARRS